MPGIANLIGLMPDSRISESEFLNRLLMIRGQTCVIAIIVGDADTHQLRLITPITQA